MPNQQVAEIALPFLSLSAGECKGDFKRMLQIVEYSKDTSFSTEGQSLSMPLLPSLSQIHIPGTPAHLGVGAWGGKELGFCRARKVLGGHFIHSPVPRQSRINPRGTGGNLSCWRRKRSHKFMA